MGTCNYTYTKSGRQLRKSSDQTVGELNTGVRYTNSQGKTAVYIVTTDGLRELKTAAKYGTGNYDVKQVAQKMIESGRGEFLSKSQVEELKQKRNKEWKEKPDYELGNPFNERGRGKRVYRPRKGQ